MPVAIKKPPEEEKKEREEREEEEKIEKTQEEQLFAREEVCFKLPPTLKTIVKIIQQFNNDKEVVDTLIAVFRKRIKEEDVPEELRILARLLQ